jgi:hypothetical protein
MIKARTITRECLDTRSSGDHRHRVDAYFVSFECPPDELNRDRHEWICRFEVPRGTVFQMKDFPDKAAAHAAKGYVI